MIDAYAWTTPNGKKLLIALEELGTPHELHWVDITKGEQKRPEYLRINPNHKIPAIVDRDGPGGRPLAVFESGAVLLYLAEKAGGALSPSEPALRYQVLEWMFFQVGGTGAIFGQLGYYKKFAPEPVPAAIERFTAESERLLGVLERRLAEVPYLATAYSIADIMNFTWVDAASFVGLDLAPYPSVRRWHGEIAARPAVVRGLARRPPAA